MSNENEVRISLYTKGLFYNLIGFGVETDIKDDEEYSLSATILKESDELYTFSYIQGEKYINGKMKLQVEEASEETCEARPIHT